MVGREAEVAAVTDLVSRADVRLVTLTGPGGVGKTRLALATAEAAVGAFRDGFRFVPLTAVTDPALVLPAIARSVGVREVAGKPWRDVLADRLALAHLFLILDNFEQVAEAAADLAALLVACPDLTALVTSRISLRVTGERTVPVAPLALPAGTGSGRVEDIAHVDAVRLLVARAQDVRPAFVLTAENAGAVSELVRRLDGLPLAIELAAARLRHLNPDALLARLERRLPLLTGGPRDAPARQRTLRDAIAWSHDLLIPDEQVLFRRLGVFVGGCTLEAAEAVCEGLGARGWGLAESDRTSPQPPRASLAPSSSSVLDGIESLLDQSLLVPVDSSGGPRYAMLESVREFSLEQLEVWGEADDVRQRHAAEFLALAERAHEGLRGSERVGWIARLEADHDNLGAALTFAVNVRAADLAQRLVAALGRFWEAAGHLTIGRAAAAHALALDADAVTPARARALEVATNLAYRQGDYGQADALAASGLAVCRQLGDKHGIAFLRNMQGGIAYQQGDRYAALALWEETLEILRVLGDSRPIGRTLNNLGVVLGDLGEFDRAEAYHRENLAIQRSLGDPSGVGLALNGLGLLTHHRGDLVEARRLLEEAVEVRRAADPRTLADTLANLAAVQRDGGELADAAANYRESLRLRWERGETFGIAESLAGLASVAVRTADPLVAARLQGAFDALSRSAEISVSPQHQADEAAFRRARALLGPPEWHAAFDEGATRPLERAVADALAADFALTGPTERQEAAPPKPMGLALSPREREVLLLLVEGRSDRQIGEELGISHRTAMNHVAHILAKLGVASRGEAAILAVRDRLL
jgi:predicted ATPase/DNA-binding CsgD family transcriptional regulator